MIKWTRIKTSYLLIAGSIVLLVISYQLAFRQTFLSWQQNKMLGQQLRSAGSLSSLPDYTHRKNANLNKLIAMYSTDTVEYKRTLIDTLAIISERSGIKLTSVPAKSEAYGPAGLLIQKVVAQGDFFALMKGLDLIGKNKACGFIRSFRFVRSKDNEARTAKDFVSLELYLTAVPK